jgi:hypothetical protein
MNTQSAHEEYIALINSIENCLHYRWSLKIEPIIQHDRSEIIMVHMEHSFQRIIQEREKFARIIKTNGETDDTISVFKLYNNEIKKLLGI